VERSAVFSGSHAHSLAREFSIIIAAETDC
jgi:hypothetical protein